jgi:transposase
MGSQREVLVMTTHCAVDFHARSQTIRFVSDGDGEVHAATLDHARDDVHAFYASLPRPVIVGIESHGYTGWFEQLLSDLGHEVWIGDAGQIRRLAPRKQKNDDRDAELLLDVMVSGRFPRIYRPSPESRSIVQLLRFRHNLVRLRTRVANSLSAIALSAGLTRRVKVLTAHGRAVVAALDLAEPLAWQRDEWLRLLDTFDLLVAECERRLERTARGDERVRRLRTQPGVGLMTGLALVHILGPIERFATSRKVVAYVGLDPVEASSGARVRFGSISKQGSKLLRHLLVEGGQAALKSDPQLKAVYGKIRGKRTNQEAKVAVARRLLVRSYVMMRDEIDYEEFCRRGRTRRGVGPGLPEQGHGRACSNCE